MSQFEVEAEPGGKGDTCRAPGPEDMALNDRERALIPKWADQEQLS